MSFVWRLSFLFAAAHAQQCVTKQLISPGDGVTFPKAGDTVSMHYTGTLASTGAKFDSSRDRGKEFSTQIGVGQVIKGWDQGVPQMSLGERATLRISASCGYGASGSPPVIPPNADLVFDVELNGINGRRAGASAVSAASVAPAAPAVSSASTLSASASSGALPRCIASSCGHAISFDPSGASRPLCLCNPLCVEWKTTPGILPCCPGLQEVCLDPYRSPSPAPAALPAAAPALPTSTPAAFSGTFSSASSISGVQSTNFAAAPAALVLPTCRPNSCGKGMASGVNSNVAICACDVSCLAPGSSLPCCNSFREVCQSAPALTAGSLTGSLTAGSAAPISQAQFNAQFGTGSIRPAASSISSSTLTSISTVSSGSDVASCAIGRTKWAEQAGCDKKRWAIQSGKCEKVCPSVDPNSGIKYYPTGQPGKDACAAALAACQY